VKVQKTRDGVSWCGQPQSGCIHLKFLRSHGLDQFVTMKNGSNIALASPRLVQDGMGGGKLVWLVRWRYWCPLRIGEAPRRL
jgi:hypothetical protein